MISTPIDKVQAGDVVAEDVHNEAGGILISASTVLSEQHLRRLKTAGVSALIVADTSTTTVPLLPSVAQRLEALHSRFELTQDPVLLQVRDIVAHRLQLMLPPTNA